MEFDYYCGLDIHKDKYAACLLDKKGNEIRSHSFKPSKEALQQFLTGIPNSNCIIIIENCTMWRYAYKIIKKLGYAITLADSNATKKLITSKKTDKYDAKALADLKRANLLPELYIPNDEILKLRDLTHYLISLREIIKKLKIKIKSELQKHGIKYSKNIYDSMGLYWLNSLKIISITSIVHILEQVQKEEKIIHNQIKKIALSLKETKLLMSIPGIAEYLATVIYAEIGTISRFKSAKRFVMYCGLCPGISQTGNSAYDIKNTRYNRTLKYAFHISSGRASVMNESYFKTLYKKRIIKDNMPKARRVIAQKMATISWHMLTKNQEFKFT